MGANNGLQLTIPAGTSGRTVVGSPGDDDIVDNGAANRIVGLAGNDTVMAGNADTVLGGMGDDFIVYMSNAGIHGDFGNDTISGLGDFNDVWGGLGNDTIKGSGFDNVYRGGLGSDLIATTGIADQLIGDEGADTLRADGGTNNTLLGGLGADLLVDHGTNDTLVGGRGTDTLVSQGTANTVMTGDQGNGPGRFFADLFFVDGSSTPAPKGSVPAHAATVTDFASGVDHISFGAVSGNAGGFQATSDANVRSLADAIHTAANLNSTADYVFVAGGSDGFLLYAPQGDGMFSAGVTLTGHRASSSVTAADIIATNGLNTA